MATLKDIGRHLNLSVTTVSRALNGFPEVSEQTRELVAATARAMNYRPNQFARKLVTGQSGMVGMVQQASPELSSNPNFIEIITGLSEHFSSRDLHFILHVSTETDVMTCYRQMISRKILDGFVLNSPARNDPRIAYLLEQGIPFVMHGRSPEREDYPYYDVDNYQVGRDLTGHLLELGHTRIALLNGSWHLGFAQERWRGYRDALAANGLVVNPDYLRHESMLKEYGLRAAAEMLGQLDAPPTAFVCSNMLIAAGVLEAIGHCGLAVPDHVSVVAHDDKLPVLWTTGLAQVTVTHSPLRDACEPLADILQRRMNGEPLENLQQVVRAPLYVKTSSAACPAD